MFIAPCARSMVNDPNPYEAKDIDEMSRSIGDPMCSAAVEFFWTVLGGCAADLALTFHADGGVFLGGGVLTRMRDQLSKERFNQGYLRNTVKRDYSRGVTRISIGRWRDRTRRCCGLRNKNLRIKKPRPRESLGCRFQENGSLPKQVHVLFNVKRCVAVAYSAISISNINK